VLVPNVVGQDSSSAASTLSALGFDVHTQSVSSSTAPSGQVVDQNPNGDTRAPRASSVTLSVSTGPKTVTVNAGDYIGRDYSLVRSELRGLGLSVQRTGTDGGGAPGTVTDVSPSGSVPVGSTVTVTVVRQNAASPSPTPTVNPTPTPTATGTPSVPPSGPPSGGTGGGNGNGGGQGTGGGNGNGGGNGGGGGGQ
jgi:serine/threonine-protein kinase